MTVSDFNRLHLQDVASRPPRNEGTSSEYLAVYVGILDASRPVERPSVEWLADFR